MPTSRDASADASGDRGERRRNTTCDIGASGSRASEGRGGANAERAAAAPNAIAVHRAKRCDENEHFSCAAARIFGSRADNWRRQGGLLSNKVCTGTLRNLWYERIDSSSHLSAPFFNPVKKPRKKSDVTSHQGLCLSAVRVTSRHGVYDTRRLHLSALVREWSEGRGANREREAPGERQGA